MKTSSCLMCGSKSFSEVRAFCGQSIRFNNESFNYGRCDNCYSIVCLGEIPDDIYDDYPTTDRSYFLPILRLSKFFKKINIDRNSRILDYGCGSGAVLSALKKRKFINIQGYDPHNDQYNKTLYNGNKYDFVYSINTFEHLSNFDDFFSKLEKVTTFGTNVFIICDTSTRIPRLNPDCIFQRCSMHAPFHTVLPSDDALIKLFSENGYTLKHYYPYDVQRSGIVLNDRVIALFLDLLGDTKEKLISATTTEQLLCLLKSPFSFFDTMFINTKSQLKGTFVFVK